VHHYETRLVLGSARVSHETQVIPVVVVDLSSIFGTESKVCLKGNLKIKDYFIAKLHSSDLAYANSKEVKLFL
jgi:hypothetical protein